MKDYEGNEIVENVEVEYLKENLKIKDSINIILTKTMKNNLINIKADTVYIDFTYRIVPPGLKNYKFLVIIGFDKSNNQLILYMLALIKHENVENFSKIINLLKLKSDFYPNFRFSRSTNKIYY